jgi:hypothetical protein
MSKRTIAMLIGFVALNAVLFGGYYFWSSKHSAKLAEIHATVDRERANVDAGTKAIADSHKSMVDMEAKINKTRIQLQDIEWRYPRGAPPDVVKKYNDMVAVEKVRNPFSF